MPVIDCHVHLNHYNSIHKTRTTTRLQNRLKRLFNSMDNNKVDYSVILTSYKVDSERPSTSQVMNIVKDNIYRNKFGIVAGFSIDNHND